MPVLPPLALEPLSVRRGDRERPIAQDGLRQVFPLSSLRLLNGDGPRLGIGRRAQCIDRARSPVDQGAGNLVIAQQLGGLLDGKSLADSAQIYQDSLAVVGHREIVGVQMQVMPPYPLARYGNLLFGWHLPGAACEPPAPKQRRDGNVECASRRRTQLLRALQQAEYTRVHGSGLIRGATVDLADIAGRAKETEHRLPALDLFQR